MPSQATNKKGRGALEMEGVGRIASERPQRRKTQRHRKLETVHSDDSGTWHARDDKADAVDTFYVSNSPTSLHCIARAHFDECHHHHHASDHISAHDEPEVQHVSTRRSDFTEYHQHAHLLNARSVKLATFQPCSTRFPDEPAASYQQAAAASGVGRIVAKRHGHVR
jgi:hypothetical protein